MELILIMSFYRQLATQSYRNIWLFYRNFDDPSRLVGVLSDLQFIQASLTLSLSDIWCVCRPIKK